jgi:hypothetical protein
VRLSIAIATALAAQICSVAGIAPDSRSVVKLCIELGAPDPWVITRGEFIAKEIFAQIGIKLDWGHRAHCPEPSGGGIVIHTGGGPPGDVHPGALAYALLGESRIEVFCDRISASVTSMFVPTLMGHVLAHEIAHVLEGVDRHSDEGIMKAHWTSRDYELMYPRPMQFAPEDVALIRAAVLGR